MGENKYLIGFTGRHETPKINLTRVKLVCERFSVTSFVIGILLQGANLKFTYTQLRKKKWRLAVAEFSISKFGVS